MRDQQEVLMYISNMVMEVFAMDTALQRLMKNPGAEPQAHIVRVFINDAITRLEFAARQVLAATAEGDALRTQLAAIRRLFRWTPLNTIKARQRIADFVIDHGRYNF
jgi:Acyl-CoA dehydrogenase, C-terminal domain